MVHTNTSRSSSYVKSLISCLVSKPKTLWWRQERPRDRSTPTTTNWFGPSSKAVSVKSIWSVPMVKKNNKEVLGAHPSENGTTKMLTTVTNRVGHDLRCRHWFNKTWRIRLGTTIHKLKQVWRNHYGIQMTKTGGKLKEVVEANYENTRRSRKSSPYQSDYRQRLFYIFKVDYTVF